MGMLDGQVAVVIGGHSGFGEVIGRRFADDGAQVVVAARRADVVAAAAERIGGVGLVCDIVDDDAVQALVAAVLDRFGRVDICVNSAGFSQSTPLRDLTPDTLRAMHDVQITGALYCMRHFGNAMADSGRGGAFCSISSLTAQNPARGLIAYASAKKGLEYATQIAAVEYGAQRVRFNCVAASLIETPMTAAIFTNTAAIQAQIEMTPLGRMGTPDDIAKAVLFLCSPMGDFITGQTVCVDGGASLLCLPTPQMYADVATRLQAARQAGGQG
jgi:NAD(P)-dependent dehydrogenase (short-subunit alcohol dehydrogenase family)